MEEECILMLQRTVARWREGSHSPYVRLAPLPCVAFEANAPKNSITVQSYNLACGFIWMWNLVCDIKEVT
jgi:hypothetical protein